MNNAQLTLKKPLVLASGSAIRATMLREVGLPFTISPANVDENALKTQHLHATPPELASLLARTKAAEVSHRNPGQLVLGADQVAEHQGKKLDKPGSMEAALTQLQKLQNSTHQQHSAASLLLDGKELWHCCDTATLTMQAWHSDDLRAYLEKEPDAIHSCGGYHFEGLGRNLFSKFQGDRDTILGLPRGELLHYLHAREWASFSAPEA